MHVSWGVGGFEGGGGVRDRRKMADCPYLFNFQISHPFVFYRLLNFPTMGRKPRKTSKCGGGGEARRRR